MTSIEDITPLGMISSMMPSMMPSMIPSTIQSKMPDEMKNKLFVKELIAKIGMKDIVPTKEMIKVAIETLRKKYKVQPSKNVMRFIYEKYFLDTPLNTTFQRELIKCEMRSRSGVLVCTVVLPPIVDCPEECIFCPRETNLAGESTQPSSYLSTEPAMLRALQYNFDTVGQIWDRIICYIKQGNINLLHQGVSYKLEIIVSGGTWEVYPLAVREKVITSIYYAANIFTQSNAGPGPKNSDRSREMLTLEEEIHINETATFRIIGLTLETRPDYITMTTIRMYRRWGVTRMQIGVQHYDDEILEKNKRSLKTKRNSTESITDYTISAIRMLKQCGFKVVVHLMPDMYGSTPEKDLHMFNQAITRKEFQFDDVKIYPTAVCKSESGDIIVTSELARMYADGTYVPYAENNLLDLINVIKYYKMNCPPWVRIQRLVRDIPGTSIEAGYDKKSNLRQMIQDIMKKEGSQCQCIRCLEIDHTDIIDPKVVVYRYLASEGIEYHIQIEMFDPSNKLNYNWHKLKDYLSQLCLGKKLYYPGNMVTRKHVIGFCRLRIDNNPGNGILKELANCALIREVHVYGSSLCIGLNKTDNTTQHRGFGQLLVKTAEDIVIQENNPNINKLAIIAGVGTREYYKNKCDYNLEGTYMTKDLTQNIRENKINKSNAIIYKISIMILIIAIVLYLYHL